MKKFLLVIAAGLSLPFAAQAYYNLLSVNLADNTKVDIVIKDEVRLSFTDDDFVATGSDRDVTVPRSELVSFRHTYDSGVGVSDIAVEDSHEYTGEALIFRSLPQGSEISVYTAGGMRVLHVSAEGDHTIPLDGLAKGVYVVSVNNKSFKINVR